MRSSFDIIKWNYNLILIILLVSVFYGSSLTAFGIKKNNKYNSFNRISNTNSNSNSNRNQLIVTASASASDINSVSKQPYEFCNKELDAKILKLALPAILNFAIVPLVGAVDTYWVSL